MPFTDDFNRANEDLEVSANWTLVDGVAGGAKVTSNVLEVASTQSVGSYHCPDQGTPDHYAQAAFNSAGFSFIGIRLTDGNNFLGLRYNSATGRWEMYKRVGGSLTQLGLFAPSLTPGDIGYIEADSSDNITVKVNGTVRIGPILETFNNTETRQGVIPRSILQSNWLDDFEAGSLAVGGVIGKSNPLWGPLGGPLAGPIG